MCIMKIVIDIGLFEDNFFYINLQEFYIIMFVECSRYSVDKEKECMEL